MTSHMLANFNKIASESKWVAGSLVSLLEGTIVQF